MTDGPASGGAPLNGNVQAADRFGHWRYFLGKNHLFPLIVQRLSFGVLMLLAVSVLIFVGTEILPGDVATAILGQEATPEALEAIRRSLNLFDPPVTRYWGWLRGALQGDLGNSLSNGLPVADQLSFRLANTLFLAGVAASVAIPLALILGIFSAVNQNNAFDRIVNIASLAAISLPEFFIGYVLILVFAVQLGWFPSLSLFSAQMDIVDRLYTIALPATALTIAAIAHTLRMTRATIIGVMSHPYIEMAFLKGLPRWRIVVQHALPNALAPIASVIALSLAWLIVGVVVVEVVFVYPGVGQLMVDSVAQRDVPVVQGCGLVFATTYICLNLIADIVAIVANPRLRAAP
jgi:peptide/nickel transport system permease protein